MVKEIMVKHFDKFVDHMVRKPTSLLYEINILLLCTDVMHSMYVRTYAQLGV